MSWIDEQKFEIDWWGNCCNTYSEETKQLTYAQKIGLHANWNYGHYPVYNLNNISVVDIGGGPTSILLKCNGLKKGAVIDPCPYPKWVIERYKEAEIDYHITKAENNIFGPNYIFDEAWIYNVLQHTDNPEKIIKNARKFSKLIRIFEWIDMPPTKGHPHELKEDKLNKWLHGKGKVKELNENGCVGKAYYGIFPVSLYEKI
jgi:hypothetical protein